MCGWKPADLSNIFDVKAGINIIRIVRTSQRAVLIIMLIVFCAPQNRGCEYAKKVR